MSGAFVDYVKPHKVSGILIYRRRFPQELVPYIPRADGGGLGRKELCVSLLSKNIDDAGAVERWHAAKTQFARLVTEAKRSEAIASKRSTGTFDVLSAPQIAYLAEAYRQEELEADHTARWDTEERELFKSVAAQLSAAGVSAPSSWTGREGARWASKTRETLEAALAAHQAMRADGDLEAIVAWWRDDALELAEARDVVLDPSDTEGLAALCRALNEAAISAGKDRLKRLGGEEYPEAPPEPTRPGAIIRTTAMGGELDLLETFDGYASAQGLASSTRKEWRRYVSLFAEFIGHQDAARITRDDIVRWRDRLLTAPGRAGKQRKPVTVRDKYMMSLACTLGWAVDERILATNVAREVNVRVPKSAILRDKNYTMDEARAVLRASLVPPGPHLPAPAARARRWLPWLCAYSGARVGELAQLRKEDVRQEDDVWMLRVTPEAGAVKTKEARLIPIHSHIIEQGFLAEVKDLPSGPMFYNPENRRAGMDAEENRHVKKVGERLAAWVRKTVGITDPDIKPNHAWRHLFATLAEEAGIAERTYMAIQGHAPASVGRKYGSTTIKAKADAMERFPRFQLDG